MYNSAQHDLERHAAVACLASRSGVVDGGSGVVDQIAEGDHDVGDEDVHPLWGARVLTRVPFAGYTGTGRGMCDVVDNGCWMLDADRTQAAVLQCCTTPPD